MIRKYYKLRRGCMYYVKEKEFRSKWQERLYRLKLGLKGWKLEELREEY